MEPHGIGVVAEAVATVGFHDQFVVGVGVEAVDGYAVAVDIMRSEGADVGSRCSDKDDAAVGAGHAIPYGRHCVVGYLGYADVLWRRTGIGDFERDIVNEEAVVD